MMLSFQPSQGVQIDFGIAKGEAISSGFTNFGDEFGNVEQGFGWDASAQ